MINHNVTLSALRRTQSCLAIFGNSIGCQENLVSQIFVETSIFGESPLGPSQERSGHNFDSTGVVQGFFHGSELEICQINNKLDLSTNNKQKSI